MSKRLVLLAGLVGLVAPFVPASPALASGPMKITRIHYAQKGNDLDTEYVVLKNTSGSTVHMKGWEIISAPSSDNQHYFFPKTSVAPGSTLTLYTGSGTNASGKRYWGASSPRWDNSGDKAILKNAKGTTVDTCQYAGGGTQQFC
jgi:hypothetical protein